MKEYVCGFMFNREMDAVVLVRKNKPEWQAGKLNGVGGKVDPLPGIEAHPEVSLPRFLSHERPEQAMAREFEEETGVKTLPTEWNLFRSENFRNGTGAVVHFFWAAKESAYINARTMESEEIERWRIPMLFLEMNRREMMYNLPYLLEMAMCYANQPIDNIPAP